MCEQVLMSIGLLDDLDHLAGSGLLVVSLQEGVGPHCRRYPPLLFMNDALRGHVLAYWDSLSPSRAEYCSRMTDRCMF